MIARLLSELPAEVPKRTGTRRGRPLCTTEPSKARRLSGLPVPVDLLIYARDEWMSLLRSGRRFSRLLLDITVWIYPDSDTV